MSCLTGLLKWTVLIFLLGSGAIGYFAVYGIQYLIWQDSGESKQHKPSLDSTLCLTIMSGGHLLISILDTRILKPSYSECGFCNFKRPRLSLIVHIPPTDSTHSFYDIVVCFSALLWKLMRFVYNLYSCIFQRDLIAHCVMCAVGDALYLLCLPRFISLFLGSDSSSDLSLTLREKADLIHLNRYLIASSLAKYVWQILWVVDPSKDFSRFLEDVHDFATQFGVTVMILAFVQLFEFHMVLALRGFHGASMIAMNSAVGDGTTGTVAQPSQPGQKSPDDTDHDQPETPIIVQVDPEAGPSRSFPHTYGSTGNSTKSTPHSQTQSPSQSQIPDQGENLTEKTPIVPTGTPPPPSIVNSDKRECCSWKGSALLVATLCFIVNIGFADRSEVCKNKQHEVACSWLSYVFRCSPEIWTILCMLKLLASKIKLKEKMMSCMGMQTQDAGGGSSSGNQSDESHKHSKEIGVKFFMYTICSLIAHILSVAALALEHQHGGGAESHTDPILGMLLSCLQIFLVILVALCRVTGSKATTIVHIQFAMLFAIALVVKAEHLYEWADRGRHHESTSNSHDNISIHWIQGFSFGFLAAYIGLLQEVMFFGFNEESH